MPQVIYTIQDMTWDGRGVTRTPDGRVVMISGALPGDAVTAILSPADNRGPLMGAVDEIITPSPDRLPHPCPYHVRGCQSTPLGTWRYEAALAWKSRHLSETLRRIGGVTDPAILDPVPSPQQWGYRERLELHLFTVHEQWWLGYLAADGYYPLSDCLLGTDPVRQGLTRLVFALGSYKDEATSQRVQVPRDTDQNGSRLVVRDNGHGEAVAVLFVRNPEKTDLQPLRRALHHAELAGWQIRHAPSMRLRFFVSQVIDDEGDPRVFPKLSEGRELAIDPVVFAQVNRAAAIPLVRRVVDELPASLNLMDFYGGYGAFALEYVLAKGGKAAVVESSTLAVRAGQAFARDQGLPVEFILADLSHRGPAFSALKFQRAAILDPPRAGADPAIIGALNENGPPQLVYVSCHPATLARDIRLLTAYRPLRFIPVDLFPQTPDVETIAIFDRR